MPSDGSEDLQAAGHEEPLAPEPPAAHHHELSELMLGGAPEGTGEPGDATIDQLMQESIGGWRGLFDSSLPSIVFLVAYTVTGKQLSVAVWSAIVGGALVAVLRKVRGQPMRQVVNGLPFLLLCAWFASRSGRAEDFYLPGLLVNAVSAVALTVSALVGHPLAGYFVGALTGDLTGWREVPEQRRAYTLATWFFVATYVVRVVAKVPLYVGHDVEALGTVGLILGWPLTALAAYLSYRVIMKARHDAPVPEEDAVP